MVCASSPELTTKIKLDCQIGRNATYEVKRQKEKNNYLKFNYTQTLLVAYASTQRFG